MRRKCDFKKTAFDFERSNALTKLFDCQYCTRCRCHRMHWKNCLFVKSLHSIVKWSNARWRLSVAKIRWLNVFRDETSKIAFDAQIVKCIDDFVCFFVCYQTVKQTNCWFNVKKTAFNFEWSNALTKLFVDVKWLHLISNNQMHWQNCLFFEKFKFNDCLLTQTKRLMFVEIANWLTDCKTNYWLFDRNVNFCIWSNFRWIDYKKFDKTKWIDSYKTFK